MSKNIGYMICETASSSPQVPKVIGESVNGNPIIEVILQDMMVKNRNGRFYDTQELAPQISVPRMTELINNRSLFGEAGHPTSKELSRQQTIDPTNLAILISKIWISGNDIRAHVEPASTRVGDDFKRLIENGTKVAFSLRALGSVSNTSRGAEVRNIKIITWDWVIYPSHDRAYMDKFVNVSESVILGESSNLICENNDKGLLEPINNQQVMNYIKESTNIKSVLESFEFLYDDIILSEDAKHVTLVDKEGSRFVVYIENYITDKIMDYVDSSF